MSTTELSKEEFDLLLNAAIQEREKRSVKKSIGLFKYIVENTKSNLDKCKAMNHLGLAYFEAGNLEEAYYFWQSVQNLTTLYGGLSNLADSLRNLARPELSKLISKRWAGGLQNTDLEISQSLATLARRYAFELDRPDLCQFTHGLISTMPDKGQPDRKAIRIFAWEEFDEFIVFAAREPKMEQSVWFGSVLLDLARAYGLVNKSTLRIAKFWVRLKGLKRREEQITKSLKRLK